MIAKSRFKDEADYAKPGRARNPSLVARPLFCYEEMISNRGNGGALSVCKSLASRTEIWGYELKAVLTDFANPPIVLIEGSVGYSSIFSHIIHDGDRQDETGAVL